MRPLSQEKRIVLLGASNAGKTSYASFSLACMHHFAMAGESQCGLWLDASGEGSPYLNELPSAMNGGVWPARTSFPAELVLHVEVKNTMSSIMPRALGNLFVKNHLVRIVDLPGASCNRIFQVPHDFPQIVEKTRPSEHFMLFVDGNGESVRGEASHVAAGVAQILYESLHAHGTLYLAIVFSKCDLLGAEPNRLERLKREFLNTYGSYMTEVLAKGVCEYFCVSCLPEPGHVTETPHGRAANQDWSCRDMVDQLAPWKWLFGHLD